MSNEMLKEAYKLYNDCLKKRDLTLTINAIQYITRLKKLYPGSAEVDSLFGNINYLIDNIRYDRKRKYDYISENEFLNNNREFFDSVLPKNNDSFTTVFLEKYDFTSLLNLTFDFLANNCFDLFMLLRKMFKDKKVLIRECKGEKIGNLVAKRLKLDIDEINVSSNFMDIPLDATNGCVVPILIDKNKYFIFINKLRNIGDVGTLVHELAHVYYFIYNGYDEDKWYNPSDYIKTEIVPRTMELLLINYLEKEKMFEEADILSESFKKMVYHDTHSKKDFIGYKYMIADFIASEAASLIIDGKITFKEFCRKIYKTPYDVILRDTRDYFDKRNDSFSK